MTTASAGEASHEDVYGRTFELYDPEQLLAFMRPFAERFDANKIDAARVFAGRRCLDAGCGGGRGALFMLKNGAAHVTAFDFSGRNVETTLRNTRHFGYENVAVQQGTLERLPYADGQFDFVWCNGVLQHAANPDRCLDEITRVLAVGGQAWLYVYGAGGVYWYTIGEFRRWFERSTPDQLIRVLQLAGVEPRYVAEYIDDWKVSYLRAYRASTVTDRLRGLGFEGCSPLGFGVPYDTNHRITLWPSERSWLGEGDLRFLLTKTSASASNSASTLNEQNCFEPGAFSRDILETFGAVSQRLASTIADDETLAVLVAARMQRVLRDRLSLVEQFDCNALLAAFENIRALAESVAGMRRRS